MNLVKLCCGRIIIPPETRLERAETSPGPNRLSLGLNEAPTAREDGRSLHLARESNIERVCSPYG